MSESQVERELSTGPGRHVDTTFWKKRKNFINLRDPHADIVSTEAISCVERTSLQGAYQQPLSGWESMVQK